MFGAPAKQMHPCFAPSSASFRIQSKQLVLVVLTTTSRHFEPPLNVVGLRPGTNSRALRFHALASGRHYAGAQSLLPSRAAASAVASNRARRASATEVALRSALPAAVGLGFWWRSGRLHGYVGQTPVPNPSVKRRANGKSPGPGRGALHSPQPGPGASPSAPAYLER